MDKVARLDAENAVYIRKRVYWNSPNGVEHGLVKKELGTGFEVYSYESGATVQVAKANIAKVITEES